MRRPEPTADELRRAWLHCRRGTWPATYDEAMADPLLSRLVRITAMHPPRAVRKAVAGPQRPATGAGAPLRLAVERTHRYLDRKRAAAGDRDDD